MSELIYGFDFGTSNTSIAVTIDKKTRVLPIGLGGKTSLPSLLYIPPQRGEYYIGERAALHYTEDDMTGRLIQSLKSILVSETFTGTHTVFGFKNIEGLIAMIMTKVREEANRLVGQNVTKVLLGRPAVFSTDSRVDIAAQEKLVAAAEEAGFKEIELKLEPIAAAMHYEDSLTREELVLVADLGGGTTDFTLIRLSPSRKRLIDRSTDILASGGVYIGGNNFNSDIMANKILKHFGQNVKYKSWDKWMDMPRYLMRQITEWENIAFIKDSRTRRLLREIQMHGDDPEAVGRLIALIDGNLGYSIFQAIELAKCGISVSQQDAIYFKNPSMKIVEILKREEFETFTVYALEEFQECLTQVIKDAGISKERIDAVFLTGGSSMIPFIRKFFAIKFGESKLCSSNNFTSVAAGLALSAAH